MNAKNWPLLLGALLVSTAALGATPPSRALATAEPLFPDQVVARGKGFEIRQSEVDEMYLAFRGNRAAMGERLPESLRPKIEADIVEKLIATRLFLGRATPDDRAKGREIAALFIAEQMKQAPSEESFNRQLRATGMSPEEFRAQIQDQGVVKAVIDREIRAHKEISAADVKKFYDENGKLFEQPERVRVAQVLISTWDLKTGQELSQDQKLEKRRIAESVLAKARAGEDFSKLVTQFTEDRSVAENKGEYVLGRASDEGREPIVPEFEAAAFSLAPGQVSDLVVSRFGYHILKQIERIPPQKVEMTKVEERIREALLQEAVQEALPAYVEKLKKEAGVEIIISQTNP